MADINITSIMKKTNKFIKSKQGKELQKQAYAEFSKEGKDKTPSGQPVITKTEIEEAAKILIGMYRSMSNRYRLPESVDRIFDTMTIVEESVSPEQSTHYVVIGFPDAEALKRNSLYEIWSDGSKHYIDGGILNVVSLLDTGYKLQDKSYPVGYWEGHEQYINGMIKGKHFRGPLGYMKEVIDNFNSEYGERYHCVATIIADDMFYLR